MSVTFRKLNVRRSDSVASAVCPVNVPCPSAAHTFTPITMIAGKPVAKITDRPDYSDGYGSDYSKGE